MKQIYLDHAATTPLNTEVLDAMTPYLKNVFGNPSSAHSTGREAREAMEKARSRVATILHCRADEVIFCSGGTESDNAAIFGSVYAYPDIKKTHIITSAIEHHAVLTPAEELEKRGIEVTYLPVDEYGMIRIADIEKAITDETVLVSIMYANNEVGTIQPIAEIGKLLRGVNEERKKKKLPRISFHTDACQAAGALDLSVNELSVDLMTLNGSKIYGPKGIGVLYVRKRTPLKPLIFGGGQEFNLRSGTENVANIVGFAKALELVQAHRDQENKRLTLLRDWCVQELLAQISDCRLNGHPNNRLPNNIYISIKGIDGVAAMLMLDEKGIKVGTRSACSEKTGMSHVLAAMKIPHEFTQGSLRITIGKSTEKSDLDYLLEVLPETVEKLRAAGHFTMH